jgi:hypothetical protein
MPRVALLILALSVLAGADHPYLLWTKADIQAMRAQVAADAAYKARAEAPLVNQNWRNLGVTLHNLYRANVFDDSAAAEAELAQLRTFIGSTPSQAAQDPAKGGIGYGGRHFDNTEAALRYDLLYDRLTPAERSGLEDTFRVYIQHQLGDTKEYTKTSWLPNMQWPRPLAAHYMAAALGDLGLLEKLCKGPAGWFWYFDSYISDGRFYNEEFGKQYSMNGPMLMFCMALRNLGRDQWGFGYTGKGGATMQAYLGSYFDILLPGIDVGSERLHYGYVTTGDQRHGSPHHAFPTILIPGQFPGEQRPAFALGVRRLWTGNKMNGQSIAYKTSNPNNGVSKMAFPLWMEIAHKVWPEDPRFRWALLQLAPAGAAEYLPTPYVLRDPVRPGAAPPAPSGAWRERGFALLRAETAPAYWTSPAPAVGLRFANNYVHEVNDGFAITNFHAFNRMLLANGQTCDDYASNDPDFSQHILGHNAVMTDLRNPAKGPQTYGLTPRFAATNEATFTAIRGPLADGLDQTRALLLTRDYLIDVSRLVSATPRRYTWLAHPLGRPQGVDGFQPYPDMTKRLTPAPQTDPKRTIGATFADARRLDAADRPWAVTMVQDAGPEADKQPVPPAWWQAGIGLRISMAGSPGTEVMIGRRPQYTAMSKKKIDGKYQDITDAESDAFGASTIAAERTAPATTFAALYEPFRGGKPAGLTLTILGETAQGIAVQVAGPGWTDRVVIRFGDGHDQPAAIGGLSAADWAYERAAAGAPPVRRGGWR